MITPETENDWLTAGKIVCLTILKEELDNNVDLNKLDYDYLIEIEKRNLVNPDILDSIASVDQDDEDIDLEHG